MLTMNSEILMARIVASIPIRASSVDLASVGLTSAGGYLLITINQITQTTKPSIPILFAFRRALRDIEPYSLALLAEFLSFGIILT
jgi:hypothetical protein